MVMMAPHSVFGVPFNEVSWDDLEAGEAPFCACSLLLVEVWASNVLGLRVFLPTTALFSAKEEMLFLELWLKALWAGVFSAPSTFAEDLLRGCPIQPTLTFVCRFYWYALSIMLGFSPACLIEVALPYSNAKKDNA
ncbi:hypothetical protein SUGI_0867670 [Cryptomeria japonica]|nr:hypothetical protein SUGI_0867670 [Cryptomeria japonica]